MAECPEPVLGDDIRPTFVRVNAVCAKLTRRQTCECELTAIPRRNTPENTVAADAQLPQQHRKGSRWGRGSQTSKESKHPLAARSKQHTYGVGVDVKAKTDVDECDIRIPRSWRPGAAQPFCFSPISGIAAVFASKHHFQCVVEGRNVNYLAREHLCQQYLSPPLMLPRKECQSR